MILKLEITQTQSEIYRVGSMLWTSQTLANLIISYYIIIIIKQNNQLKPTQDYNLSD